MGHPFHLLDVRRSVQNLQSTGRYRLGTCSSRMVRRPGDLQSSPVRLAFLDLRKRHCLAGLRAEAQDGPVRKDRLGEENLEFKMQNSEM